MSAAVLDDLVAELEDTATRLRTADLEPAAAADLVDRCAQLAVEIGSGLDRAGREAEASDAAQEQLL